MSSDLILERRKIELLKEMLIDQVVALGRPRPDWASLFLDGDLLLLVLCWEEEPVAALPRSVVAAIAELVVLDRGRQLTDLRTAATADGRRVMISLMLGAVAADPERGEALRNWSAQVRRAARAHRAESRQRRQELARLRAEISVARLALRRQPPAGVA
jgi:hypothetical protein